MVLHRRASCPGICAIRTPFGHSDTGAWTIIQDVAFAGQVSHYRRNAVLYAFMKLVIRAFCSVRFEDLPYDSMLLETLHTAFTVAPYISLAVGLGLARNARKQCGKRGLLHIHIAPWRSELALETKANNVANEGRAVYTSRRGARGWCKRRKQIM